MFASLSFSTYEHSSKIEACGDLYGAVLGALSRNIDFKYYRTILELSQSLFRSSVTSRHVEVATDPRKHAEIRLLPSKAMPPALGHVSLLSCAHATKGTQTMDKWSHSEQVASGRTVARATCLPLRASPCPRACRSPSPCAGVSRGANVNGPASACSSQLALFGG